MYVLIVAKNQQELTITDGTVIIVGPMFYKYNITIIQSKEK
jgi:hypothetical protein